MAATQAPKRGRTRSSGRSGQGTKAASAPSQKKATGAKAADGTGREAAAPKTTKVKEPKVYVFGGSIEAPQPGANARRLWKFLSENLSKAQLAKVKAEIVKAQAALPEPDRFVRWQRVVAACSAAGVETVKVGDSERKIGQGLVRALQVQDKDGVTGRDSSITIL